MRSLPFAVAVTLLVVGGVVAPVVAVAPASGQPAPSVADRAATSDSAQPASVGDRAPESEPGRQSSAATSHDACEPVLNGTERPDPETDTLGWENGCWYDANITIDRSDGINETEREAFLARTMARAEYLRELEFQQSVPVEVISQAEFADRIGSAFDNTTTRERVRQNVKWKALMIVNETRDAVRARETNVGTGATGYYNPSREVIVLVSANRSGQPLNEPVVGHEMVHALQNQHYDVADRYDLSNFELRNTTEELHALNGIIEGDASLVERWYRDRCGNQWNCLLPSNVTNTAQNINWGLVLVNFQPYSDGPGFVKSIYDERGWAGVDEVLVDPPESAEQVVSPEKFRSDPPTRVAFTDRSQGDWQVLRMPDEQPDYVSAGLPTISAMFITPYYYSGRNATPIVPIEDFVNQTGAGQLSTHDPVRYAGNNYSEGWDGDRLYVYVNGDVAVDSETGYVWKTAWDSPEDAAEFVDGYEQLLDYYNATAVEGRENTYRIPDEKDYSGTYYVNETDTTVVITHAQSVSDLRELRPSAAPRSGIRGLLAGSPLVSGAVGVLALALVGGVAVLVRRRR